jgi:hypothetical protein
LSVEAKTLDFEAPALTMDKSTRSLPRLSPVNGKPILLGFDGVDMSSDAGLILLREIERQDILITVVPSRQISFRNRLPGNRWAQGLP